MVTWQTEKGEANGYLALPEGGQGPGVLVLHAWWGLTEFFKGFCDKLAAEGFVVLAPDLFGNGATAETIAEAEQLAESAEAELEPIQAIVSSAVQFLQGHPAVQGDGIGTVGFSFGAAWALLLATVFQPTDLAAVVLFYGNHSGIEWDDYAKSKAAFLGHFAEDDPYEDVESVQNSLGEIHKAGREAAFHFYPGTGHWFFEENQPDAYNAEAAELAWERTVKFLREQLR
jgi:carboxymethylenebutenolidase